jgi:hypothetical protein
MAKYHIRFNVQNPTRSDMEPIVVSEAEGDTPEELYNRSMMNWENSLMGTIAKMAVLSGNTPEHIMGCMSEAITALDKGEVELSEWTVAADDENPEVNTEVAFEVITHATFEKLTAMEQTTSV